MYIPLELIELVLIMKFDLAKNSGLLIRVVEDNELMLALMCRLQGKVFISVGRFNTTNEVDPAIGLINRISLTIIA